MNVSQDRRAHWDERHAAHEPIELIEVDPSLEEEVARYSQCKHAIGCADDDHTDCVHSCSCRSDLEPLQMDNDIP